MMTMEHEEPTSTTDYLAFRAMVAVPMIQTVFYCAVAIIGCFSFGVWSWRQHIDGSGPAAFEAGFIFLALAMFARLSCEVLIVIFKIHEALERITLRLEGKQSVPVPPELAEHYAPIPTKAPTQGLKVYS